MTHIFGPITGFYLFLAFLLTILDLSSIVDLPQDWEQLLQKFNCLILSFLCSNGPLPRHVAFIMDGNRRFARFKSKHTSFGHFMGAINLFGILKLCFFFGIETITVFAFSTDNFSRPKEEIQPVFDIIEKSIIQLLDLREYLKRTQVRVRVIGDISRFPKSLSLAIRELEAASQHNSGKVLNICCSYNSREEVTKCVKCISEGLESNLLIESDADERLLNSLMEVTRDWRKIPSEDHELENAILDVDLIVRTSGERRLSDFLTWQASQNCNIQFSAQMWPNFRAADLILTIIEFQKYKNKTPLKPNMENSALKKNPALFLSTELQLGSDGIKRKRILDFFNQCTTLK